MKKIENVHVSNILDILYKKYFGRNLFLFVMGMLVSALAINLFFDPYNVIPTGSSGLAFLITEISGIELPTITFLISVIILLLGFIFFGFDYVFLQDQSQAPAKVGKDRKKHAQLIKDMAAVAEMVRDASPECKPMVECTWAYPGKDNGGFESYEAFYAYAKKGAKTMAKAIGNSKISPIADAFDIVRNERPDINLYHTDSYHQSKEGSYLKSCVNYLMLFGIPFGVNAAECHLDKDVAAYLRSVAERVVLK